MKIFQPLVLAGGLLCLAAPSFAGHWDIQYQADGTRSVDNDPVDWVEYDSVIDLPYAFAGFYTFDFPGHENHTVKLEGWAQPILYWRPDYPGEAPLNKNFLASTTAAIDYQDSASPTTWDVENGFSQTPDVRTWVAQGKTFKEATKFTKSLFQVDPNSLQTDEDGNLFVLGPKRQFKSRLSIDNTTNNTLGGDTFIAYDAQPDPRSVKLIRGAKDRFEVDADGNWVTHGDTTYSYSQTNPPHQLAGPPVTLYENKQIIASSFLGNWGKSFETMKDSTEVLYEHPGDYTTEQWTPPNDPAEYDHLLEPIGTSYTIRDPRNNGGMTWIDRKAIPMHKQVMPMGGLSLDVSGNWVGTPTGGSEESKKKIISFSIADNDGATSQAQYILHLHDEVEFTGPESVVDAPSEYKYAWKLNGTEIQRIDGSTLDESGTGIENAVTTGVDYSFGLSLGIPLDKIWKLLNISNESPLDLSVSKTWSSSDTQNDVRPFNQNIGIGQKALPISILHYQWHLRYYHKFDSDGEVKTGLPTTGPTYGPGSGYSPDGSLWETAYKKKTSGVSFGWIWADSTELPDPNPGDTPPSAIIERSYGTA